MQKVFSNPMRSALPCIGDVVADKYRLESSLGRGAMGSVFSARHELLHQRVAIKFLAEEILDSPAAVSRFMHEGRAAARIRNEHAVRVLDVDTLPTGWPYIVLEYLDGCDMAEFLHQRGSLPVSQSVDFVMQALEAVAEAHVLGLVHRDLKPANLFIVRRSDGKKQVKVLDFGISKSISEASSAIGLTSSHALLGSPAYMSPEQATSAKDVDARADIWAVGVILYELIAGDPPFTGKSVIDVLRKVSHVDPQPLTAKRPDVTSELEEVIFRCLRRNRNARFRSAADLANALLPFGSDGARSSYESILGVLRAASACAPVMPGPLAWSDDD